MYKMTIASDDDGSHYEGEAATVTGAALAVLAAVVVDHGDIPPEVWQAVADAVTREVREDVPITVTGVVDYDDGFSITLDWTAADAQPSPADDETGS